MCATPTVNSGSVWDGSEARSRSSGTTVAVMDWDSHRYLECYFAIPMLGAVMQTVNVRLTPQQILFTLKDSRAEVILVNREFVPLLAAIRPQLDHLKAVVVMDDGPEPA